MKGRALRIASIVSLLLLSVGIVFMLTFRMPELTGIDGIRIGKLNGDTLEAVVASRVYNGNIVGLGGKDLRYVVSYRDTVLGQGKAEHMYLPAGDTTNLELGVKIDLQGVFAVYSGMLAQQRCTLDLSLAGKFTFLNYAHSFRTQTVVEPQTFVRDVLAEVMASTPIAFMEIRWKKGSLKESTFSFVSELKNPLPLPFTVSSLWLEFSAEKAHGKKTGEWELAAPVNVGADSTAQIPGEVQISNAQAGKDMLGSVLKGKLRYYTWGAATVEVSGLAFEVPISGAIVINPLSQKGTWEN